MKSIKEFWKKLKNWQKKQNQYYNYLKWVFIVSVLIYPLLFTIIIALLTPWFKPDEYFLSNLTILLVPSIIGFLIIAFILYFLQKIAFFKKHLKIIAIILLIILALVLIYITFTLFILSVYYT
jgi:uncharacterized protein YacL